MIQAVAAAAALPPAGKAAGRAFCRWPLLQVQLGLVLHVELPWTTQVVGGLRLGERPAALSFTEL